MKTKLNRQSVIVVVALTIMVCLSTSCQKGDTGPKGEQGAQGPAGPQGNVTIKTTTFTTASTNWTAETNSKFYYYNFSCPDITPEVMKGGAVLVYVGDGNGTQWGALPFSFKGVELNYALKPLTVEIDVSLDSGAMPNNPGGIQFKIVVIPPSMIRPNVDVKDYVELEKTYGGL